MLIYDYEISTPQDMYMYVGFILILNIYFTKYPVIMISTVCNWPQNTT